ncbi:MAG TPA: NAD(P)-dependent alcohol dehydrogenase [Steroidobacteraceae bacterium]
MTMFRVAGWLILALVLLAVGATVVGYWMSDNVCESRGPAAAHPMKAALRCEYGAPEVVEIAQVEKPVPGEHEVLVKVRAAAVNPLDWHYLRGTPYLMRLESGLRKPKVTRLGVDFAGVVAAVGPKVTGFKPGDEVFGGRNGSFAEYVIVRDDRAIVPKPASVTFEQAAAVPIAAVTALQALRDRGQVGPGSKVLINGASGGVGTYAVQIARALGAEVTGVCSGRNVELVRSLGAAHVVDYTKEDYATGAQRYDVIIDNVGNRSLGENRKALKDDGRYVLVGGGGPDAGNWVGPMLSPVKALLMSPFVSQQMGMMLAELNARDLATLGDMMQSGAVRSVIDRSYTLEQLPEALAYLEKGRARGKVVITVP